MQKQFDSSKVVLPPEDEDEHFRISGASIAAGCVTSSTPLFSAAASVWVLWS
jgi:hypothetical protein